MTTRFRSQYERRNLPLDKDSKKDLETHDVLDLLPDREAESVKQWLLAHPEIEIISRDRAGAYADGAAQGAPQAQQIADRWHLCKNLRDAVEDYLKRKTIQLSSSTSAETASPEMKTCPSLPSFAAPVKRPCASQAKTERKQQLVDQVKSLHQEGNSIRTIAAQLDLARNTVRHYLRLERPGEPTPRPRKPSQLDPFSDYLSERFQEGCSNASHCFRNFRKKAIVEEKPRCAVLWRVFARDCLAWFAHPNMQSREQRCR